MHTRRTRSSTSATSMAASSRRRISTTSSRESPSPRDIAPVPSRLERLADELRKFYGLLPTPPADPFALFVWDVLSFKSTPQKRALAFAALKRHRALTPDSMSKLAQKKLEDSVKLAGPPFEQRLRALRTGVSVFQHHS